MRLIIDIPEEMYKSCKRECEETDDLIIDTFTFAIGNGAPIPDNATNGDVIKAMFPDAGIRFLTTLTGIHTVAVDFKENILDQSYCVYTFNLDWWNAPYQKGGSDDD